MPSMDGGLRRWSVTFHLMSIFRVTLIVQREMNCYYSEFFNLLHSSKE